MKLSFLRWVLSVTMILLMLYPMYQIKSALGIDLIQGPHTPTLLKETLKSITHRGS